MANLPLDASIKALATTIRSLLDCSIPQPAEPPISKPVGNRFSLDVILLMFFFGAFNECPEIDRVHGPWPITRRGPDQYSPQISNLIPETNADSGLKSKKLTLNIVPNEELHVSRDYIQV